jgi:hypothetical protein
MKHSKFTAHCWNVSEDPREFGILDCLKMRYIVPGLATRRI